VARSRGLRGGSLLLLFVGGVTLVWLAHASLAAGRTAAAGASVTTINVTLGKPSEFSIKLSKLQAPVGTVVFKVTNQGKLPHNFKVCARASSSTSANACLGKVTPTLAAGTSALLRVVFASKGSYEFLCAVSGHAKAGMKGLLGVGQKAGGSTGGTTTTTATTTTTTKTTTTTTGPIVKPPATETLGGDPSNGASVFGTAGCGSCHTLAAAHSSGSVGPNLDRLAPGQAIIVTTVTNGSFGMPPFGTSLTSAQINDLAAYVYQSTHQ
jgi:mono/diheme cytochrome c family protein